MNWFALLIIPLLAQAAEAIAEPRLNAGDVAATVEVGRLGHDAA